MANPQKEDGHVDIANEIIEALAKTHLSSYETQVIFAIFRKTYGWHKKEDWITNSQIAKMTGIAEAHISRTIKILLQKNIVKKNGKRLGIQKDYEQWEKLPKGVTSHHGEKLPKGDIKLPKGVIKVTKGGIKKLPKGVYTKETKETTTKENIQKIKINDFHDLLKRPNINSEEKKKPNNIEFDTELLSWHGIDEDILDKWVEKFPNINVSLELIKIREYFKRNPKAAKDIEIRFKDRFCIYIYDWLERASKYKIADSQ